MSININKVVKKIKNLEIQGATNIAKETIKTLLSLLNTTTDKNFKSFKIDFLIATKNLAYARPTGLYAQSLYLFLHQKISTIPTNTDLKKLKFLLKKWLGEYELLIKKNENSIIQFGVLALKKYNNILTHCHSSIVVKIFASLHKKNPKLHVFADETRPLYQGRLTAKDLIRLNIPVTQLADSASGFLISPYSGKDLMIQAIVVGADAIKKDGSIINKIGTYDIAASAYLNKIPFFVATSLLKFDYHNNVKIEMRSDKEIWPNKPAQVRILNYAFDRVPAKLISGLITEFGVIKPKQVASIVKRYLWLK